jgi:hypothetical protein
MEEEGEGANAERRLEEEGRGEGGRREEVGGGRERGARTKRGGGRGRGFHDCGTFLIPSFLLSPLGCMILRHGGGRERGGEFLLTNERTGRGKGNGRRGKWKEGGSRKKKVAKSVRIGLTPLTPTTFPGIILGAMPTATLPSSLLSIMEGCYLG